MKGLLTILILASLNLEGFRILSKDELDELPCVTLEDGSRVLLLGGRVTIITKALTETLTKSPFSGEECVSYKIEAYCKDHHIGTYLSKSVFYAEFGRDTLIEAKSREFHFPFTYKKTFKVGEEPGKIRRILEKLGLDIKPYQGREITCYEWCIYPEKEYILTIERFDSVLPPEKPEGESIYEIYHRMLFETREVTQEEAIEIANAFNKEYYKNQSWVEPENIEYAERHYEIVERTPYDPRRYWVVRGYYKAFVFTVVIDKKTGKVVKHKVEK